MALLHGWSSCVSDVSPYHISLKKTSHFGGNGQFKKAKLNDHETLKTRDCKSNGTKLNKFVTSLSTGYIDNLKETFYSTTNLNSTNSKGLSSQIHPYKFFQTTGSIDSSKRERRVVTPWLLDDDKNSNRRINVGAHLNKELAHKGIKENMQSGNCLTSGASLRMQNLKQCRTTDSTCNSASKSLLMEHDSAEFSCASSVNNQNSNIDSSVNKLNEIFFLNRHQNGSSMHVALFPGASTGTNFSMCSSSNVSFSSSAESSTAPLLTSNAMILNEDNIIVRLINGHMLLFQSVCNKNSNEPEQLLPTGLCVSSNGITSSENKNMLNSFGETQHTTKYRRSIENWKATGFSRDFLNVQKSHTEIPSLFEIAESLTQIKSAIATRNDGNVPVGTIAHGDQFTVSSFDSINTSEASPKTDLRRSVEKYTENVLNDSLLTHHFSSSQIHSNFYSSPSPSTSNFGTPYNTRSKQNCNFLDRSNCRAEPQEKYAGNRCRREEANEQYNIYKKIYRTYSSVKRNAFECTEDRYRLCSIKSKCSQPSLLEFCWILHNKARKISFEISEKLTYDIGKQPPKKKCSAAWDGLRVEAHNEEVNDNIKTEKEMHQQRNVSANFFDIRGTEKYEDYKMQKTKEGPLLLHELVSNSIEGDSVTVSASSSSENETFQVYFDNSKIGEIPADNNSKFDAGEQKFKKFNQVNIIPTSHEQERFSLLESCTPLIKPKAKSDLEFFNENKRHKCRGKRVASFFSDSKGLSKDIESTINLPPARGVWFDSKRNLWRASWRENGSLRTKGFSIGDLGLHEARIQAIAYRIAKVPDMEIPPDLVGVLYVNGDCKSSSYNMEKHVDAEIEKISIRNDLSSSESSLSTSASLELNQKNDGVVEANRCASTSDDDRNDEMLIKPVEAESQIFLTDRLKSLLSSEIPTFDYEENTNLNDNTCHPLQPKY